MRRCTAVAAAFLLAGCALLDHEPALEGLWGSDDFMITADQSMLTINHGCWSVAFAGPIRLIDSDSFAIQGSGRGGSAYARLNDQGWRAWGRRSGDTLRVTTSIWNGERWSAPGKPTVLVAGRHVDYIENPSCVV